MATTKKQAVKKKAPKKVTAKTGLRDTRSMKWKDIPERPRSRQLHIQLTEAQSADFQKKCHDAGLPRSTIGRMLVEAYNAGRIKLKTKTI